MRTIKDDIYTYNTETGTAIQTRVIPLFEFFELNKPAQDRVVAAYMEEREADPYFSQWFIDSYECEIWDCVRDLEKSITGARAKWSYNRWYSCDFDCEYSYDDCYDPGYIEPVKDSGYYASMDLCDAWNAHARKLNGLYYQIRYIGYLMNDVYPDWDYWVSDWIEENKPFNDKLDSMYSNLVDRWYVELEKACDDVRDAIETLLRNEWEWYTSEEYARAECEDESTQGYECRTIDKSGRVYYSDCRKWYTAAGELFDQSDVNRVCVSIVKA